MLKAYNNISVDPPSRLTLRNSKTDILDSRPLPVYRLDYHPTLRSSAPVPRLMD